MESSSNGQDKPYKVITYPAKPANAITASPDLAATPPRARASSEPAESFSIGDLLETQAERAVPRTNAARKRTDVYTTPGISEMPPRFQPKSPSQIEAQRQLLTQASLAHDHSLLIRSSGQPSHSNEPSSHGQQAEPHVQRVSATSQPTTPQVSSSFRSSPSTISSLQQQQKMMEKQLEMLQQNQRKQGRQIASVAAKQEQTEISRQATPTPTPAPPPPQESEPNAPIDATWEEAILDPDMAETVDRLEALCGVRPQSWAEYQDAVQLLENVVDEVETPQQQQQQQHTTVPALNVNSLLSTEESELVYESVEISSVDKATGQRKTKHQDRVVVRRSMGRSPRRLSATEASISVTPERGRSVDVVAHSHSEPRARSEPPVDKWRISYNGQQVDSPDVSSVAREASALLTSDPDIDSFLARRRQQRLGYPSPEQVHVAEAEVKGTTRVAQPKPESPIRDTIESPPHQTPVSRHYSQIATPETSLADSVRDIRAQTSVAGNVNERELISKLRTEARKFLKRERAKIQAPEKEKLEETQKQAQQREQELRERLEKQEKLNRTRSLQDTKRLQDLKRKLEATEQNVRKLETMRNEADKAWKKKYETVHRNNLKLQADLKQMEVQLETTRSSERELQEEITQLRSQHEHIMHEHETSITELNSTQTQLKSAVLSKTREAQQVRDDAAAMERKLRDDILLLQQELEQLKLAKKNNEEELVDMIKTLTAERDEIERKLSGRIGTLQREAEEAATEHNAAQQKLQQQLQRLTEEKEQRESELTADIQKIRSELAQTKTIAQETETRQQERIVKLQQQVEQLQSDLMTSVANERQSALRAEASEADKRITEQRLQLALDRAQEQLAELQQSTQRRIADMEEQNRRTFQQLQQQMQTMKQAYRSAEMEMLTFEKIIPQH